MTLMRRPLLRVLTLAELQRAGSEPRGPYYAGIAEKQREGIVMHGPGLQDWSAHDANWLFYWAHLLPHDMCDDLVSLINEYMWNALLAWVAVDSSPLPLVAQTRDYLVQVDALSHAFANTDGFKEIHRTAWLAGTYYGLAEVFTTAIKESPLTGWQRLRAFSNTMHAYLQYDGERNSSINVLHSLASEFCRVVCPDKSLATALATDLIRLVECQSLDPRTQLTSIPWRIVAL